MSTLEPKASRKSATSDMAQKYFPDTSKYGLIVPPVSCMVFLARLSKMAASPHITEKHSMNMTKNRATAHV